MRKRTRIQRENRLPHSSFFFVCSTRCLVVHLSLLSVVEMRPKVQNVMATMMAFFLCRRHTISKAANDNDNNRRPTEKIEMKKINIFLERQTRTPKKITCACSNHTYRFVAQIFDSTIQICRFTDECCYIFGCRNIKEWSTIQWIIDAAVFIKL